ncbi:MAG: deoxyhypusine synthase [Candidatus Bathyarchaeota archaeon B26-1]|nr:MAG: deoxyhypusine synthase [Candidatus Bathyarchaeota archaeon B26-1]
MKTVKQIEIKSGMSVGELVREMEAAGVLGAGKIGEASKIVAEMFGDPRCTVFLTLAGPLVPGGLRKIIANLLEGGYVDVIVTTGANLVHDMVESLGFKHYRGTFKADDKVLKDEEIGRIGDVYIEQKAFQGLEDWLYKVFDELPSEMKRRISITDLLTEIGRRLPDKNSILATAARKGVPIICPAFLDSIAGFHLWMYGQDGKINVDPLLDVSRLMDKVYEADKAGIIILGGGVPKHFALFANTFREGVDLAVQITMDRPEPGGLSGATLEEAISWSKVKPEGKAVTVICDVTIAFPLIVAAALEYVEMNKIGSTSH